MFGQGNEDERASPAGGDLISPQRLRPYPAKARIRAEGSVHLFYEE